MRARPAAAKPGLAESNGEVDVLVPPALEPSVEAVDAFEVGPPDDQEAAVCVVRRRELAAAGAPRPPAIANRDEQPDRVRLARRVEAVHAGLRHTRGAAVAVAMIDPARRVVTYGGIGNIAGLLADDAGTRRMISYNGTAGHGVWKVQAFTYPFADRPVVVMHSDGLATSWTLDSHPGLLRHDPAVIAATLYRDHARGRDDCGVLVWKG